MREHASALLIIHAGSSDMVKMLKETHATASTRHISRVLPPADQKMKLDYRLYKNSRLLLLATIFYTYGGLAWCLFIAREDEDEFDASHGNMHGGSCDALH